MKRNTIFGLATILACTLVGPLAPLTQGQNRAAVPTLDPVAKSALIEALAGEDGEYAARATYVAIIDKFGPVQPYANILLAEEQHIAALKQQCVKYGVPIPADPYLGNVAAPETLLEAAEMGVEAEELNIVMYDELLKVVMKYPSLVNVFSNLRAASLYNHLPAFEAAVANGGSL